MVNFSVFNHSSINMTEVDNNSVDYIITSPPYNIGHQFSTYIDQIPDDEYIELISTFIKLSAKKMTLKGKLIIDMADCIALQSKIIFTGKWLESLCHKSGLNLVNKASYILKTNGRFSTHTDLGMISRENTNEVGHSASDLILVFQKDTNHSYQLQLQQEYSHHPDNEAFWSQDFVRDLLHTIDCSGNVFLDPFMGGGGIGIEIIKQGGYFYGYDIVEDYIEQFNNKANEWF